MLKKYIAIGSMALLTSFQSFSAESSLSYTSVSAAYISAELDDDDFGGFGLSGSVALNETVFLLASYSTLESDDEFTDGFRVDEIEFDEFSFGVGFHTPIGSNTDFVASVSRVEAEFDFAGDSVDGDGFGVSGGVRSKVSEIVELAAGVTYVDIEDEDETGFSVSARVYAAPQVSFGFGIGTADDTDTFSFDLRLDI